MYNGDALSLLSQIKNIRISNSIYGNKLLGFPFGQDLHDIIAPGEIADHFIIWLLQRFSDSDPLTLNLFFFLTFPLVFSGGYVGSRLLKISAPSSTLIGLLYTFLPYHHLRGVGHLYLANYTVVPILVALSVRQLSTHALASPIPRNLRLSDWLAWLRRASTFVPILLVVLGSMMGMYYAFFGIVLIIFSGILGSITNRTIDRFAFSFLLISTMAVTILLQMLPVLVYQLANGNNLAVVGRSLSDLESYGLKITGLLTPVINHRLDAFAEFSLKSTFVPIASENTPALGILGSICLLSLFFGSMISAMRGNKSRYLPLAIVAGVSIALGTIGGFAQFGGQFGFTQLRAWNRISVAIAFVAFAAFGKFVDHLKLAMTNLRFSIQFVAVLLVLVSILDMSPRTTSPSALDRDDKDWLADSVLIQGIEKSFGRKAAVFQFPVMRYPENGPVGKVGDYEHLKGYLHSEQLRWSYGGVKGRTADWQQKLPLIPTENSLRCLRSLGFEALWLNTDGYEDPSEITNVFQSLGLSKVVSREGDGIQIYDVRSLSKTNGVCSELLGD
jgi:phosphoglycerol transferase